MRCCSLSVAVRQFDNCRYCMTIKLSTCRRDNSCVMRWRCARQTWHFVLWLVVVAAKHSALCLIKQECRATIMSDDVWCLKSLIARCHSIDVLSFTPTLTALYVAYVHKPLTMRIYVRVSMQLQCQAVQATTVRLLISKIGKLIDELHVSELC